jgi:ribosomal RNA-processing protein 12
VRYNASGALRSLLDNCATPTVMAAMQQQQQQQRGGMSPLQSLVSAVAAALGARYQEAWGLALPGEQ